MNKITYLPKFDEYTIACGVTFVIHPPKKYYIKYQVILKLS